MPHRPVFLHPVDGSVAAAELREHIDALLAGSEVPVAFPAEVLAAAEAAAASVPAEADRALADLREVPFVTLDPATSTDLDQAMHLERTATGFRVRYAIADVPLFVPLDGPVDVEARRRGQTLYLPDRRIPLHPEVISEGAASLLPDQDAPAFVWDLDLDAEGRPVATRLVRAMVRSREKLAYDRVQEDLDAGRGHPMMLLLREIGALRVAREREREGASLNVPEQEVLAEEESVRLIWRTPTAIEDANAQISLLTGMVAAQLMIEGGAGILRTMPPADEKAIRRFRRQAAALGEPWDEQLPYGAFLRSLTWSEPRHLALLNQAAALFRGAGYLAFATADELPAEQDARVQAAIGAPYAHATAPLRRLVDRFVLLTCHALSAGQELPAALREALPLIPAIMAETAARGGAVEREAIDLVEVMALRAYRGRTLEGTVIDRREPGARADAATAAVRIEVQLLEPPVTTWVPADVPVGERVRVRLEDVDLEQRRSTFALVDADPVPGTGPAS